jgi:hypothetical protein
MHVRQQIREAVVEKLTGLPTTLDNVFTGRAHNISDKRLPGLAVRTADEVSDLDAKRRDPILRRDVALIVEIRAQGNDDTIVNLLDGIAAEVEIRMGEDPRLGGLATNTVLTESGPALDPDGNAVSGVLVLQWTVAYRTSRMDPERAL